MRRKRYSKQQALMLLTRLLAIVEAPAASPAASPVRVRALLAELLRARFGDIAIRDAAAAGLAQLSDGEIRHERLVLRDQMRGSVHFTDWDVTAAVLGVRVAGAAFSADYVLELEGRVQGLLTLQLVYLLRASGGRLRACKADDCERLFVREGKREFCSYRCQKRIYMRQQRAADRAHTHNRGRESGHGKATRKG